MNALTLQQILLSLAAQTQSGRLILDKSGQVQAHTSAKPELSAHEELELSVFHAGPLEEARAALDHFFHSPPLQALLPFLHRLTVELGGGAVGETKFRADIEPLPTRMGHQRAGLSPFSSLCANEPAVFVKTLAWMAAAAQTACDNPDYPFRIMYSQASYSSAWKVSARMGWWYGLASVWNGSTLVFMLPPSGREEAVAAFAANLAAYAVLRGGQAADPADLSPWRLGAADSIAVDFIVDGCVNVNRLPPLPYTEADPARRLACAELAARAATILRPRPPEDAD